MTPMLKSLYSDHRSISAVLDAMQHLVRRHTAAGGAADVKVYRAILYYLDVFPERHHHPKEEQSLFPAIRAHTHDADSALDTLTRQHAAGEASIRALEQKLLRYEAGGEPEWADFALGVDEFIAHYEAHMRLEEDVVMPIAARALTAEDWRRVEAEFARQRDPLAATEPAQLLHRIVMLAPPPIGIGPAAD